jgi:exportin-2 (importin alpha re-exporter)
MEMNDATVATMAGYLQQTMSPDASVRKPAEEFLKSVEAQKNYGPVLLQLLGQESGDQHIRVAGAIAFKNFIKRNWKVVRSFCDMFNDPKIDNFS